MNNNKINILSYEIKNFLLFMNKINYDNIFYDAFNGKYIPFKDVFPEGSYSIVGNSPITLENQNGDLIDNSDYIIRFNNFKLDNYESHVGSKTNMWITGGGVQAPNNVPNIMNMKKILLFNNSKTFKNKQNRILEKYKSLESFIIFHNDLIITSIIKLLKGIPTTGFIILLLLGCKYKDINTFGFTFGKYKNNYHYYPDNVFQDHGHRWGKELQIFKILISKKILKNNELSYKKSNTNKSNTNKSNTNKSNTNKFNTNHNTIVKDTHNKLLLLNKMLNI